MEICTKLEKGDFARFAIDGNFAKTTWGIVTYHKSIINLMDGSEYPLEEVGVVKMCPSDKMGLEFSPIESFQYVPMASKV